MKLFLQLISFSLTSSQCRVCAVLRGVPHPGYSTHRGTGGLDPIPGDILTTATSLQGGDRTHSLKLSHSVKILIENHFFDRSLLNLPGCRGLTRKTQAHLLSVRASPSLAALTCVPHCATTSSRAWAVCGPQLNIPKAWQTWCCHQSSAPRAGFPMGR